MSNSQEPRDKRFIAAAALIGLIVVAGILAVAIRLIGGDGSSDGNNAADPTSTTGTAKSSSTCGVPDGDQSVPPSAPEADWHFIGKIAAPKSDSFGPAQNEGGVATCFAHSPTGALFAAATIAAETYTSDAAAEEAARARIVPGDLLDQALSEPADGADVPSQIAGFKFEDATQDRVTLTLAARISSGPNAGALGATPMTMVWRKGDWWWDLQPTTSSVVVTSLEGFTEWSGIS